MSYRILTITNLPASPDFDIFDAVTQATMKTTKTRINDAIHA